MRVPPLQAFSSYLQSQAAAREKAYQQQPSITISREAGSGAVTIGQMLVERFMVEDARLPVETIVEELLGLHPTPWLLVQQTTRTILRLASLGCVILVGRGADVVTKRLPYVFHVRLVAPLEKRVQHAAQYYNLTAADAAEKVREEDHARRRYLRRYFDADIDDPLLYDLVINTGRLGFVRTAELIAQAAMRNYEEFLKTRPPRTM